jgi:hypothetical protein
MAEATTNNVANVSSAKGVKGGYIFVAPAGTTLPTNIETKLDKAFTVLGFISEDGYVESMETDSEDFKDVNGDLIDSETTSYVESATFTLAEIKAKTLKLMYGDANVTDENGVISVAHNSAARDEWSLVLELVLKNNRRWRKVVPIAKTDELGDMTIAVAELAAREITMKYLTDEAGSTCYDYYESTETSATGA